MKIRISFVIAFGLLVLATLCYTGLSHAAAAPNTYQVTGPVLEMTDTMIAVQKGKDRWELGRDASTKVTGDLKVGANVTIVYKMTATSVEVKPAKAAKKP